MIGPENSREYLNQSNTKLKPIMSKGGKFLTKLWCCVGGRVQRGNLVL